MGKDREVSVKISNCSATKVVGAKESDLEPSGDNSFHCPVTGSWVNLKRDANGKIVCSDTNCDFMPLC